MNDTLLTGQSAAALVSALVRVRDALRRATLPLEIPDVEIGRLGRTELLGQLEDYVLPRIVEMDAPLLTVVGGSTGAGKSTLVNSLVGARVTEPGVLRPTTRSPVLIHHPDDATWFDEERILPGLQRSYLSSNDPAMLQLVASEAIPRGLAVLDAPDIDSVETQNRELAAQLLGAADLWLFVTSAARYADQVPWDFLKQAADRSAAVAIVLDRTQPEAVGEVSAHLARMLTARGLRDSPLFIVPEGDVDEQGLLPSSRVRDIRGWLSSLAADPEARGAVVRQTLGGVVRTFSTRVYAVADACHDQVVMRDRLTGLAEAAYAGVLEQAEASARDGSLISGDLSARWQDFVETGELLRGLDSRVGRLRDRVSQAVKGQPQQAVRVGLAVESALRSLLTARAEEAAGAATAAWSQVTAGRVLIEGHSDDLSRTSLEFRARVDQAIRAWQAAVVQLIRDGVQQSRLGGRAPAAGVNGLAVALMLVVLDGGDPIPDLGRNDPVQSARKILAAVLGDGALRQAHQAAVVALRQQIEQVFASELRRFVGIIDALDVVDEVEDELRWGARRVDDLRFSAPGS